MVLKAKKSSSLAWQSEVNTSSLTHEVVSSNLGKYEWVFFNAYVLSKSICNFLRLPCAVPASTARCVVLGQVPQVLKTSNDANTIIILLGSFVFEPFGVETLGHGVRVPT